jgi:dipeptidyl aminopeptidase/acylaminoacyl peptidase
LYCHPYDCFFYTSDRRSIGPETMLAGFQGYLTADAYVAYERIGELWSGVIKTSCWVHGRRKFEACHHLGATHQTRTALAYFRKLFDIEDRYRASSDEVRLGARQEQSKPIVEAFHEWLEAERLGQLPKSKLAGAINYMLNRWESFSPDDQQLGFTLYRPTAPGDAYSIRLDDGRLTRWTFSEVGGLNPDGFVEPKRFQYASFDDRKIPAYYFQPKQASPDKKTPVLIHIHGGPEAQYRPYLSGTTQYYVNELGLAVIAPNVRGSRGYGKDYLKLDNGTLREDSVRDIGALLDWIAKQPELDSSRIAVTGGSYGGYMVLSSLAHYPDRIKAGVDRVGIANFITFLENTAAYRRDLRRAEYGDERDPEMRAHFEKINPTSLVDQIQSALLVAHGKNDPRVPFSEAQQIADKVRSQGRPVWTVYADNEGHGFAKKDNADYLRAVQVLFLREQLKIQPREWTTE